MKCHQRIIRESAPLEPDEDVKRELARSFANAAVREISRKEAEPLILKYEWLGDLGSSRWYYGLYFGEHLAGVEAFGTTGGNRAAAAIAGKEHAHRVCTLTRGCCLPWADNPVESGGRIHTGAAASFLLSKACRKMADEHGKNIVIAYADPRAFEEGRIYLATNFEYIGKTAPVEQYRMPDGTVHDTRQLSGLTRDRRGGGLTYTHSREAQRLMLLEQGAVFFPGTSKRRFMLISGDRRTKRMLRSMLKGSR
jgi:hypothetical protein